MRGIRRQSQGFIGSGCFELTLVLAVAAVVVVFAVTIALGPRPATKRQAQRTVRAAVRNAGVAGTLPLCLFFAEMLRGQLSYRIQEQRRKKAIDSDKEHKG